jgi:UDP-N-acetylglucosamine diphosphorylase/glucosamine-1-phosphate N-acetyltransferase
MKINLFDDSAWNSLRPLTFTRPVADLRIGILTIAEKWSKWLTAEAGFLTQSYLSSKYPLLALGNLFINGSICPDQALLSAIQELKEGESLRKENLLIAYKIPHGVTDLHPDDLHLKTYRYNVVRIFFPEDLFKFNSEEIKKDYSLLTKGRSSLKVSSTNTFLGDEFFAEPGAEAECSTFNSINGPIYIGENAQVWEGSNIRGSFALCHDSQVKMGTKIYGQTTIGPYSRVGGEINNAVIWGHSAKGHEGYLGNSVLGEWCNIGADSNNSNLKNNYADVKLWDYNTDSFRNTHLQFCGLIMADHSKCGINTMFNTGTVVGVSVNVFGGGFPKQYIPDFSWGGSQGFEVYALNKMFETTQKVFHRKKLDFTEIEKNILTHIFNLTLQNKILK